MYTGKVKGNSKDKVNDPRLAPKNGANLGNQRHSGHREHL